MEETALQTQGERRRGEGAPGTEIHLQAQNKAVVSTSSLWRIHAGAGSSRNCGLWRKAPTFGQDMSPMGDAAWWSILFLEDCTPWKGPVLEQLIKDCLKQRRSNRDKVL